MSRLTEQELKARLTPEAVEPPEGLLETLRADIPQDLRMSRLLGLADPPPRWRPGGTFWKIAAVLVLAAGAGWLASRMGRELPAPGAARSRLDAPEQQPSVAPPRPLAVPPAPAGGAGSRASAEGAPEAAAKAPGDPFAEPLSQPSEPLGEPGRIGDRGASRRGVSALDRLGGALAKQGSPVRQAAPGEADESSPGAETEYRSETLQSPPSQRRPAAPAQAPERDALQVRTLAEDGTVLPGAVVELAEGANRQVSVTDRTGTAVFLDVPPGKVQLKAHLEGFDSLTRELEKEPNSSAKVEMKLPLAMVTEEIVVTAKAPPVVFSSSSAAMTYGVSGRPRRPDKPKPPLPEAVLGPPAQAESGPAEESEPAELDPRPSVFVRVSEDRLSSFGLDVDTGSYTLVRRWLELGRLPPAGAVRVEEMVNFFDYGDPPPSGGDFAMTLEGGPSVYGTRGLELLRVGFAAREVGPTQRAPAALTFLVDVSGSMEGDDKLALVRSALEMLLDQLRPDDSVALVAFSDSARVIVAATHDLVAVRRGLASLAAGGSTQAEEGLLAAYDEASRAFRPGALNRVILCSDGIANVGLTDPQGLLRRIGEEAVRGLELTTLGVGAGGYNDTLMERLADQGDGRYAYLDSLEEARRVLVEELTGTLQTVARDARVQVELNPESVAEYRLLGYENRAVADEAFRRDDLDAGEIGAGHRMSALYELRLHPGVDDQTPLARVILRWFSVEEGRMREIERWVRRSDLASTWSETRPSLRLAALVAELAEILRSSPALSRQRLETLAAHARRLAAGEYAGDPEVAELVEIVERAAALERAREKLTPR